MKNITYLFIIFYILTSNVIAQDQRTFNFNKSEVSYYLFSNMTPGFTQFPNHEAKFILVNEQGNLLEDLKSSKINDEKIARNDRTLYYYLKIPRLKNDKEYVKFLKEFVEETYNRDFFDRNTTSIDFQKSEVHFSCDYLTELNKYFSKLIVSDNSSLLSCQENFVLANDSLKINLTTSIEYENIDLKESMQKRKNFVLINELDDWKNKFFITLTFGQFYLDSEYTTDFDEETFVDVNEIKSIWSLTSGYMFTNKIGGLINFSLKTKKSQSTNFDGVNISGSGNGIGLFKFGVGARYMPFAKKRWSIYGDVQGGVLSLIAEGGTGSGTLFGGVTRNLTEKSESTTYVSFAAGTNYRLGKTVYLNSNIDYTNSKFDNNIGSISGFTGFTVNLGLGFSF